MDVLRDPIWQFIGAIIGFVAIIVPIVVYVFLQRRKKGLSYEIIASTPLISLQQAIKDRVVILYDGIKIETMHLLLLRVFNSGTVPILPEIVQISFCKI